VERLAGVTWIMAVLVVSEMELSRLDTLQRITERRLTCTAAAKLLGLSRRQVHRLLNAYRTRGPAALVSQRRGQPSNRRHPTELRHKALGLVRERYHDFGPTFAAEKLAEHHDLRISHETLRQWMIQDGLWLTRPERKKRVHQPRPRRGCYGELIQIDGCEHPWFEARGPKCTLLVFVDDATGKLMQLAFAASESTFDYFRATRAYLEAHGKPLAFYSDRHGIFRVNRKGALRGDGMTQFGRALHTLNIDILCASSPEAKGRVERAHQTLQDRLVKELRLAGIADREAGNAFLPGFMTRYNARFAKPAAQAGVDAHRSLATHDDLDTAFCRKEERRVSPRLTLQHDKVVFLLEPNEVTRKVAGQQVRIFDYPDGRLAIRHQGLDLPYRVFDQVRQVEQGTVVEHQRLDAVLASIREEQLRHPERQRRSGPRRRGQANSLFTANEACA
jgi:transposase